MVDSNSHAPSHRFSIKSMLIAVFLLSFILAAYCRGSQLLGIGVGVLYAIVASLLVYLFLRAVTHTPVPKTRLAILAIVVLSISGVFAFPHYLNWDLAYVVKKHAAEHKAHRELSRLLASDPAFAKLQFTTANRKVLNVDIQGYVDTVEVIDTLRTQLMDECEFLGNCYVRWEIDVLSTGRRYSKGGFLFDNKSDP